MTYTRNIHNSMAWFIDINNPQVKMSDFLRKELESCDTKGFSPNLKADQLSDKEYLKLSKSQLAQGDDRWLFSLSNYAASQGKTFFCLKNYRKSSLYYKDAVMLAHLKFNQHMDNDNRLWEVIEGKKQLKRELGAEIRDMSSRDNYNNIKEEIALFQKNDRITNGT